MLVLDVLANRFGKIKCDMSCAAFTPDERYLCIGTDQGAILILNVSANRLIRTLSGSSYYQESPDEPFLHLGQRYWRIPGTRHETREVGLVEVSPPLLRRIAVSDGISAGRT
jgi:hypothetical protein